jgi:hypothetical protein
VYFENRRPCVRNRDVADLVLDDVEDFYAAYPDRLAGKFSFAALLHGHEPSLGVVRTAEDRTIAHLEHMLEAHPNTVHIITSDHGIGWTDFASSQTGQIERALPFAFLVVPTAITDRNPQIREFLLRNENMLTTPADLYATVVDLLGGRGQAQHREWWCFFFFFFFFFF